MSLSALLHPAKAHFPLAANAGNTSIELSAADATEVNRMRLAYGGSVRMLIYAPATVDNPTPAFETVLIDDAPTSNVFTVAAMTSEASYTTAREAAITFDLDFDGEQEQYSTAGLTASNCSIQKVTGSLSGVQALRLKTSDALGYCYNAYTVAAGENYLFSCVYKTESGDNTNIVVYDVSNSAEIFNSGNLTSTSWARFSSCFKVPSGCTSVQVRLYGVADGDICYFDNINLGDQLISNPGFEASGSELTTNGDMELDSDWPSSGSPTVNERSSTQAHGGTYSRHFTTTGANSGIANSNIAQENKTYFINLWLYPVTGTSFNIFIGGQTQTVAVSGLSVGTWNNVQRTVTTATGGSGTLFITSISASEAYVDDISVKEVEGWTALNATLELDSSNERSGTYCAKVTVSADAGYVRQSVSVTDNTWYTATFHAKQSAAGHRYALQITGNQTVFAYYSSGYIDESGWVERSVTFKVSGDSSLLIFARVESSGEIVYFDDWSLDPLCEKSATTETPSPEADHYKDGRW